ncbi:hypothetical protein KQH34_16905 [Erwinia amylovora]|uniref:Uncharacterized protein n=4 Tax=Erwinia amylovora TaxID=552 RepID=A0A831A299_ERWAM|nr:hypothetical protein [Erwinia amylovora]EKV54829.1 hypothetical protein EaACW_2135 [Erwinia amylovora ACW56400]CBA21103.1 hypothetical protein predicted by Glimmer/Critica [Erwinia amylovora CFBP1430]CBX80999.1 hypothetical protein predicted by Glimmer/Critica [Erwinia amylovora ATCC BAA-2158]CCO78981.1 hypothetical protein BN432_2188 [Erwinia amylovora Ea356]CCO82782.1 hypothetical protein BN433_2216 [Erwinia amylovora Ea266]CCO86557.1 hypothetical protein BN434_2174 [Erwinia amylovora CF
MIEAYNPLLNDRWRRTGRKDGENGGSNIASDDQHIYFPQVQPTILKQGFGVNK